MDAKLFFQVHGRERAREVAEAAGTNYRYFYEFVIGKRRPSVELARRLVKASDGELDILSLLHAVDWDEKRKAEA